MALEHCNHCKQTERARARDRCNGARPADRVDRDNEMGRHALHPDREKTDTTPTPASVVELRSANDAES